MECVSVPHWQCCFTFKYQKYWSELDNKLDPKGHWAKCRNIMAARNYCAKVDSRVGETFCKGYRLKHTKLIDPLEGKTLYRYQKEILEIIEDAPDDRLVYWYWSSKGNIGKSCLVKHMCMKHNAIFLDGKASDAKYGIAMRKKADKPIDLIVFDIPRSKINDVTYDGIEGIKNGCFYSTKYECDMVLHNPPHVFVFANAPPLIDMLSEDRWKVTCLDLEEDLP